MERRGGAKEADDEEGRRWESLSNESFVCSSKSFLNKEMELLRTVRVRLHDGFFSAVAPHSAMKRGLEISQ